MLAQLKPQSLGLVGELSLETGEVTPPAALEQREKERKLALCAVEVRQLVQRASADVIRIGEILLEVNDLLPHGAWGAWVEREAGFKKSTAYNLMQVAQTFGQGKFPTVGNLEPTALYLLAQPWVDPKARTDALDLARDARISQRTAKTIVAAYYPVATTEQIRSIVEKELRKHGHDLGFLHNLEEDTQVGAEKRKLLFKAFDRERLNYIQPEVYGVCRKLLEGYVPTEIPAAGHLAPDYAPESLPKSDTAEIEAHLVTTLEQLTSTKAEYDKLFSQHQELKARSREQERALQAALEEQGAWADLLRGVNLFDGEDSYPDGESLRSTVREALAELSHVPALQQQLADAHHDLRRVLDLAIEMGIVERAAGEFDDVLGNIRAVIKTGKHQQDELKLALANAHKQIHSLTNDWARDRQQVQELTETDERAVEELGKLQKTPYQASPQIPAPSAAPILEWQQVEGLVYGIVRSSSELWPGEPVRIVAQSYCGCYLLCELGGLAQSAIPAEKVAHSRITFVPGEEF